MSEKRLKGNPEIKITLSCLRWFCEECAVMFGSEKRAWVVWVKQRDFDECVWALVLKKAVCAYLCLRKAKFPRNVSLKIAKLMVLCSNGHLLKRQDRTLVVQPLAPPSIYDLVVVPLKKESDNSSSVEADVGQLPNGLFVIGIMATLPLPNPLQGESA